MASIDAVRTSDSQRKECSIDKLYLQYPVPLVSSDFQRFKDFEIVDKLRNLIADYDTDLLICVSSQIILTAQCDLAGQIFSLFPLIIQHFNIKPHLVITEIDPDKRYHQIFSFEAKLQRLGIRVREQYSQNLTMKNMRHFLSENGIGNNDHIPIQKPYVFVCDLVAGSGAFSVALSQIFCDQEIGISSGFALKCLNKDEKSDFSSLLSLELSLIKKIRKYIEDASNPLCNYNIIDDMFLD